MTNNLSYMISLHLGQGEAFVADSNFLKIELIKG